MPALTSDVPHARISPVVDLAPDVADTLAKTVLRPGQEPLNVFRTLAAHPRLLRRINALTSAFIGRGTVPERVRELVILRVASRLDCSYEWRQHESIARAAGVDEAEINAIRDGATRHAWSPADTAVLAMTDELIDTDDITDATWAVLRGDWSDENLVELILLVGCYRMMAGFMRALRVVVDA